MKIQSGKLGTKEGGQYNYGVVFKTSVSGYNNPTVLFSFDNSSYGMYPHGSLVLSADGTTLYGMTKDGTTGNHGSIFSEPVSGGNPTILYRFGSDSGTYGSHPYGSLTLSVDGTTLYGMTKDGGSNSYSVIFSISVAGGTPTVLYNFDGSGINAHGANPYGSLTLSADGLTLYGMTYSGGGTAYYGTNYGVIFSISVAGGTPTVLHNFYDSNYGIYPKGSLILSGSTLYGMTYAGGADLKGVIFSSASSVVYDVSYNGNGNTGGSVPTDNSSPYNPDSTVTVLGNTGSLTKTGYTFNNWEDEITSYAPGTTFTITQDTIFYAQWTALPSHTVTFDANGGSGSMALQSRNVPTALTSNTFTKTGYTFSGWNTEAKGSGTAYTNGASYDFSADMTLYAQWTVITYTVSYNANGATSGSTPASQTKAYGIDLTLRTNSGSLTKTGYTFSGWNTAVNGSGTHYNQGGTYSINSANTLYSEWTAEPTPTTTPAPTPTPTPTDQSLPGHIIINKISPLGSDEWIELLNTTNQKIGLNNWTVEFTDPSRETMALTSSYEVPKSGLLTIAIPSGSDRLNDSSGTITVKNSGGVTINAVSYGSGNVPTATDDKIIFLNNDAWEADNTPPKGWFVAGAPSAFTIASGLVESGVNTNLGTLPDLTHAQNLFFEKTDKGRIEFSSTLNLTDSDVVAWLQNLGSKLDMSTVGQIGLDANTVKELISTQATLTMYNITLNDPKILVDGAEDNSNVVSGLVYDKVAHTLTFNAAHFTTFKAVEKDTNVVTSSGSNNSTSSVPICGDIKPASIPDLFQIDVKSDRAILYFTPISNTNNFVISFSEDPLAERYGETITLDTEGVQSENIFYLKPRTTYYFKVRGQNGCMPGDWSNIMKITTRPKGYNGFTSFFKYYPTKN